MVIGELALFLLYTFLCQLVFSSSLPHLCPDEQAVVLLQFKNMFTINLDASYGGSYLKTVTWNKSADCCSWDGVHCDEMTGQVTKLDLANNRLRGNNELNDTFPKWLGALSELQILNLRSNKLFGPINVSRTDNLFAQIRVIDLSSNGFSGDLPVNLFENFQAMKIIGENSGTREYVADIYSSFYTSSIIVTTKGLDLELPRVLTTEIIINLSRNRFEGQIPSIIGDLVGLRTLNLSHNRLEGDIPVSLHKLSVLESLDLSSNKINGEIPQQLVSLTSLEVLNLSHNHLVGCIPKGKQFNTFDNSSYQGNNGLRGLPLSKDCGGDEGVPEATTPFELDDEEEEEEDSPMISWQAVLMGYGCGLVIGLSIIYIILDRSVTFRHVLGDQSVTFRHDIWDRSVTFRHDNNKGKES